MILNTHRNASPRLAKTWLALITSTSAIVAVAVICSAPRLVLAQVETTTTDIVAAAAADVLPVVHVTDVVPAASIAGLPHPDSAGSVPPHAPLTATISVVPGFKAGSPVTVTTSPAVIAGPDVSLAPVKTRLSVTASVPGQPAVLAAIKPPATPLPQPVPRPAQAPRSESPGASLEERLDRLERMLNSLMNQQNQKGHSDFQLKLEREGMLDRKEIARIEGLAKQHAELARKMNPQESERIKERATREAQQAVEQAKRATAEMEKARKADQKQALRKLKAEPQRQLEDLRRQVETLERQREKLDREIERLEQDQQELDEHDDDSADIDTHFNESKEICVTETHSQSQSHSAR